MASSPKSPKERNIQTVDSKFFMNNEESIVGYARTIWNLLGNPIMIDEKVRFPYQRVDIPLGKKTRLTGERGFGLYGYNPTGKKDLRLTLTRDF